MIINHHSQNIDNNVNRYDWSWDEKFDYTSASTHKLASSMELLKAMSSQLSSGNMNVTNCWTSNSACLLENTDMSNWIKLLHGHTHNRKHHILSNICMNHYGNTIVDINRMFQMIMTKWWK